MPKKNLLISAALTAFILVIGTGIASAYQRVNSTIEAVKVNTSADIARVDQAQPVADAALPDANAQLAMITHEEAALVASNYFGQTDLYSVENVVWEGVDAYEVVFSTGDSVYISMTGEVLGTKAPEPVVVIEKVSPIGSTTISSTTNGRSSSSTSYSGDDHDDGGHEEHDD